MDQWTIRSFTFWEKDNNLFTNNSLTILNENQNGSLESEKSINMYSHHLTKGIFHDLATQLEMIY